MLSCHTYCPPGTSGIGPKLRRWSYPSGGSEDEAEAAIIAADEMWASGEAAVFAVVPLDQDDLLGTINLTFYGSARASLGYDVVPEARGRGVATRALALVSDWAFATFDELIRLEVWILPGNEPSVRVAERAGFQREGVFRSRLHFAGSYRDVVAYSLLRSDPR